MSTEIETPCVVIEIPVHVNDKVWFIADDELYGGMVFSGCVTEVTITDVRVRVESMDDMWTIPLAWFNENKAFTSELELAESSSQYWMDEAVKEKRENRKLRERITQLISQKTDVERKVGDLEFELNLLKTKFGQQ